MQKKIFLKKSIVKANRRCAVITSDGSTILFQGMLNLATNYK